MSDADATIAAGAASADERRTGVLSGTGVDLAVIGIVVLSLFFERLDYSLYESGRSSIPDLTFDGAIAILSLRYLYELLRGRVALARVTSRELVIGAFVLLVLVLSMAAKLTLPSWMTSSSQTAKTTVHIAFLGYTAILIGRALSRELVIFALKTYFWLATAAAVLAIVQAVDLNAAHGTLTRHLHLVSRSYSNGYEAPCSFFSEPASLGYACVAAVVIAVLLARLIGVRRAVFGAALCSVGLLLAIPAGPILVAAALAVVLVLRHWDRLHLGRRGWAGVGALVAALVAVAAATPVGSTITTRASHIVNGSDASGQYRTTVDSASIKIWRLAPATGVGIGNSRRYMPYFATNEYIVRPLEFNNSSSYLSILGETGPIGLAALLVVIAALGWPASRRPGAVAEATELNVLGTALSFFVIGGLITPPLWFWGGLRLADARADGGTLRRWLGSRAFARLRPALRLRVIIPVLALVAAAAFGYGIHAQAATSHRSLHLVRGELTTTRQPGDRALARTDLGLWAALYTCGAHCDKSLHHVGGRIWEIDARLPRGKACLLVDLGSFGQTVAGRAPNLTSGFTGLTRVSCG